MPFFTSSHPVALSSALAQPSPPFTFGDASSVHDAADDLPSTPVTVASRLAPGQALPALPNAAQLQKRLSPFVGATPGNAYRGPSWIAEDGLAAIVVVCTQPGWVAALKAEGDVPMITWRWNHAPSAPLSFTVVSKSKVTRPFPRWFGDTLSPEVQAIKEHREFWVTFAHPNGQHTGWMRAKVGVHHSKIPSGSPGDFDRLFTFPVPGIPGTREGHRTTEVVTANREEDGLPLWIDEKSDFWVTLSHQGPWTKELTQADRLQATWGERAHRMREIAAGFTQVHKEEVQIAGNAPFFDASGLPLSWMGKEVHASLSKAALRSPSWALFAAAAGGPSPDSKVAHEAAVACLLEPGTAHDLIGLAFNVLGDVDDDDLLVPLFKSHIEAAVLDSRITQEGTLRPWLANEPQGMVLKTTPMDMTASVENVEIYWRQAMDLGSLIDTGHRVSGSEFPLSSMLLGKAMEGVKLEGSEEEAHARTLALLEEAKQARQWSVPWGARIELQIGPFVALRVFEMQGEFSCHFLDDKDHYFWVSIGLRNATPQISSNRIPLILGEDGEFSFNTEAEVMLELVASAVVRDFLVVEERESAFSERPFKRRIGGRDVRSVIYLPRVNYRKMAGLEGAQSAAASQGPVGRSRHGVAPHIRRVGQASVAQKFMAQRYGIHVPEGFTFVRPHERGGQALQDRIKVYRSRSASRMLFQQVDKAPVGTRPRWFDFEKDCARVLRDRGLDVIHQAVHRDGDGGVDLFASDSSEQTYVVQCKCYSANRPVGPEVVRELVGAIALADQGAKGQSKGILMTTSTFTSGAVTAALALGFELIDGAKFSKLLAHKEAA
jgi:Restriction endonuclease